MSASKKTKADQSSETQSEDFEESPASSDLPELACDVAMAYPNKGKSHTIEHVYDLSDENLRKIHWQDCVLAVPGDPELAASCASGEQLDCLSTVTLCWSGKDWGTENTEAQLRALREGQSAQVMDDRFRWEALAEINELEEGLQLSSVRKHELEAAYSVRPYRLEAFRRLRGVENVLSRIPPHQLRPIIDSDPYYALVLEKLRRLTKDPRDKLVEKVALYHWFLKSNLAYPTRVPMV